MAECMSQQALLSGPARFTMADCLPLPLAPLAGSAPRPLPRAYMPRVVSCDYFRKLEDSKSPPDSRAASLLSLEASCCTESATNAAAATDLEDSAACSPPLKRACLPLQGPGTPFQPQPLLGGAPQEAPLLRGQSSCVSAAFQSALRPEGELETLGTPCPKRALSPPLCPGAPQKHRRRGSHLSLGSAQKLMRPLDFSTLGLN